MVSNMVLILRNLSDTDIAEFEKIVDENYHKSLIKQTSAAASWLNESQ